MAEDLIPLEMSLHEGQAILELDITLALSAGGTD
jgi:hypothetical protein